MPDLPFQPFGGADQSAETIRRRAREARLFIQDQLGIDPEVFERELAVAQRLGRTGEEVGRDTALGAAIARSVPGIVGRGIASVVVGAEKDPETGKLVPGSSMAMNAAPSPVGLAPPSGYNLPPNFWLPEGVTNYVPVVVDELHLGLPEQRAIDERNARIEADQELKAEMRRLARLSSANLEQLVIAPPPTAGSFFLRGITNQPQRNPDTVRLAAQFVLAQRAEAARVFGQQLPPRVPATPQQIALAQAFLDIAAASRLPPVNLPFSGVPIMGSIQVTLIPALTSQAIANQRAAQGINKELVTERVDP